MKKKNLVLLLILPFYLLYPLSARIDTAVSSAELFSRFVQSGFLPDIQLLDNSSSTEFPFNIIFSFGSTQTASSADIYKNLIISITQEETLELYEPLCTLLAHLTHNPPPYNVKIVCGANDISMMPEQLQRNMPAGLQTFVNNLDSTEHTAALVLESSQTLHETKRGISITPGSSKRVTPPWLVSLCMKSFSSSSIPFSIKGQLMALYRLGLLGSNSRIEYLLSRSVAAAGISFSGTQQAKDVFLMIENFILMYEAEKEGVNDTQYTILPIPLDIPGFDSRIIISERALIFTVLATAAAGLFILCGFSFMLGEKSRQSRRDFKKTWYLVPLTGAVNFLFFFASQHAVTVLFPSWQAAPEAAALLKIAAALCMMFLFSFIQYTAHFPSSVFIYGYLLTLTTFINIFIFSVTDISLVLLFTFVYLLAYYIRTIRRTVFLIISSLLMMLPFVYYAVSFISASPRSMTLFLTDTPVIVSMLISMLIIPFQLIIIRILVRFQQFGKVRQTSKRRKIIEFTAVCVCLISICAALIILEKKYSSAADNGAADGQALYIQEDLVSIHGKKTMHAGSALMKCTISSPYQVVRHDVQVISDDTAPVYDASHPFDDMTKTGTAYFNLDENPPEPLIIQYSAASDKTSTIRATSYVLVNGRLEKAESEFVFKAQ